MKCITFGLQSLLQKCVPEVNLAPLSGSQKGKLRLGPEQLLTAIHAIVLAEWALARAQRLHRPVLAGGAGGRPQWYSDTSILLTAVVQSM